MRWLICAALLFMVRNKVKALLCFWIRRYIHFFSFCIFHTGQQSLHLILGFLFVFIYGNKMVYNIYVLVGQILLLFSSPGC